MSPVAVVLERKLRATCADLSEPAKWTPHELAFTRRYQPELRAALKAFRREASLPPPPQPPLTPPLTPPDRGKSCPGHFCPSDTVPALIGTPSVCLCSQHLRPTGV